ncbi:tRNA uridine-5-carboxymethylaminomethyl(34) synthesis GTPase MnmE [bacterium]|nr:tRNA uridine-5-carboxymethylaminomethyl(34) synthesis GTPase MnmE [bacterium]
MLLEGTIVAQATAVGAGAIGIIRLSGAASAVILKKIFNHKASFETHKLYHGKIINPETSDTVDDVMAVYMKAPHSFTGEDVVEIHAHGSPAVLKKIVEVCILQGAQQAEPGEFSKRAFLNGKIDLSQAEAICDLISAQSDEARKNALSQLDGFLSRTITVLREKLIQLLAALEAGFDFSEEDVTFFKKEEALPVFNEVDGKIKTLLDSFKTGLLYKEGVKVALVGKPNVGKSSLLNALINQDRAIIHDKPGTTRDVVEGERMINGYRFLFSDTAGIRSTTDDIEQEGIRRSEEALGKANGLLIVLDTSRELDASDNDLLERTKNSNRIVILNKSDQPSAWNDKLGDLKVSAKNRTGIDDLINLMKKRFIPQGQTSEGFALTNLRHFQNLTVAHTHLSSLILNLPSLSEEMISAELMAITQHLGAITGVIDSELVLDEVFSRFCIGK